MYSELKSRAPPTLEGNQDVKQLQTQLTKIVTNISEVSQSLHAVGLLNGNNLLTRFKTVFKTTGWVQG